jgi:tetratricopeptide (TPR) repeat protein
MLTNAKDKYIHFFAILAIACTLHLDSPAQQNLPAALEKLFETGVQALKAGDLDSAEKSFESVLRRGGKAAFVYHNLGIVHQQRGDHAKAVIQFREALRLQPNFGQARLLFGVSLLALGKISEATKELERAVKLLPREPRARIRLAKAYELRNNWFAVIDQYQALREMAPQEAEYAYQLGRAYARLSEWSHKQIIQINPDAARLHQSLGQQYLMQGQYDRAIGEYKRAAEVDPQLKEIHLALALIYLEQKKFKEALQEVEQELKLVPGSRKALDVKQKIDAASSQ